MKHPVSIDVVRKPVGDTNEILVYLNIINLMAARREELFGGRQKRRVIWWPPEE